MNQDVLITLISSGTTLLVGVLAATATYKAAIKGASEQIRHQQKEFEKSIAIQNEFAKSAIERFIKIEIKVNFQKVKVPYVEERIDRNKTFQYGFGGPFSFEEFNRIKYDLIKFKSEIVDEIIDIYDLLFLIDRKKDLKYFTESEYVEFKRIYHLVSEKYM